jgi:hypothetical protein
LAIDKLTGNENYGNPNDNENSWAIPFENTDDLVLIEIRTTSKESI